MARMSETSNFPGKPSGLCLVSVITRHISPLTWLSLRARIGIVPQNPIMFDDIVMNNVRYARLNATDQEVFDACKAACIHEQILGFTDGKRSHEDTMFPELPTTNDSLSA